MTAMEMDDAPVVVSDAPEEPAPGWLARRRARPPRPSRAEKREARLAAQVAEGPQADPRYRNTYEGLIQEIVRDLRYHRVRYYELDRRDVDGVPEYTLTLTKRARDLVPPSAVHISGRPKELFNVLFDPVPRTRTRTGATDYYTYSQDPSYDRAVDEIDHKSGDSRRITLQNAVVLVIVVVVAIGIVVAMI